MSVYALLASAGAFSARPLSAPYASAGLHDMFLLPPPTSHHAVGVNFEFQVPLPLPPIQTQPNPAAAFPISIVFSREFAYHQRTSFLQCIINIIIPQLASTSNSKPVGIPFSLLCHHYKGLSTPPASLPAHTRAHVVLALFIIDYSPQDPMC
jgi:hypothetical protein